MKDTKSITWLVFREGRANDVPGNIKRATAEYGRRLGRNPIHGRIHAKDLGKVPLDCPTIFGANSGALIPEVWLAA